MIFCPMPSELLLKRKPSNVKLHQCIEAGRHHEFRGLQGLRAPQWRTSSRHVVRLALVHAEMIHAISSPAAMVGSRNMKTPHYGRTFSVKRMIESWFVSLDRCWTFPMGRGVPFVSPIAHKIHDSHIIQYAWMSYLCCMRVYCLCLQ